MAGALNKQGRLLYFYGLGSGMLSMPSIARTERSPALPRLTGITLASNNNNHEEYKFEVTLLSQYQEDFSSYTLKQFMDDYTKEEHRIKQMQRKFTLIKAKVLLAAWLAS
ncbi:unnamed protein product [Effrenium voratum]|nr:unnamed protein product [Effrenium voratum]